MIVDLTCANQILKLFEPSKGAVLKRLGSHVDFSEQIVELARAAPGIPLAFKIRQTFADFLKRNPITPVIGARSAQNQAATGKGFCHDFCDLLHTVIMGSVTDIEYLFVNHLAWRVQHGSNGPRNVEPMHQRPPGSAVAGESNLLGRPSQTRKVIQNNVETHLARL